MTILFWILCAVAAGLFWLGGYCFWQGSTGRADPTGHGNEVAIRFSRAIFIVAIVVTIIAALIRIFLI